MTVELVEAERDENRPFQYFPGQPADHLAVYPLPHLIHAFVTYGYPVENKYLERCKIMLRAGLVPDSLGKTGSPTVGVKLDYDLAFEILRELEQSSSQDSHESR